MLRTTLPEILRDTADPPTGGGSDRTAALEARLAAVEGLVREVEATRTTDTQARERAETEARVARAVRESESAVAKAKADLTAALEGGEAAEIADAQVKVGEATAELNRRRALGRNILQDLKAKAEAPARAEPAADTTNLDAFMQRNPWFDTDPELTRAARTADAEITGEGLLQRGSKAYFQAIEDKVRAKYPDKLGGATPPSGSDESAPQTASGAAAQTRIPQQIADVWRRMGIDTNDPEVLKRMAKRRDEAASKGLLPPKPAPEANGRIVTR